MKNVLVIESSPRGEMSTSRKITRLLVEKIKSKHAGAQIHFRDLSLRTLPHLDGATLHAFFTPAASRTAQMEKDLALSNELIAELKSADTIVIGAPMWNFSIPSVLKSWIDHVVRVNETFSYATGRPEGLVRGKKVFVVSASGGVYSDGPMKAYDHQVAYLKSVLGFLGMTDLEVIHAEGLSDPAKEAPVVSQATQRIQNLV